MNTASLSVGAALLGICCTIAWAQDQSNATLRSVYSKLDFALTADATSDHWKMVSGITAENDPLGAPTPHHRTEVRSRWSDNNLYLLFICQYEELYSKPNPSTTNETNRLWEWDVAEAFIGSNFQDIKRYAEFQVSPHGEWVDLDIDRNPTPPNHDWQWNSGFGVRARIDEKQKIWYGEMRIPFDKLDKRPPRAGQELRINLFRFQGPPPNRKRIAWRRTGVDNYHVPEAFGLLRLEK